MLLTTSIILPLDSSKLFRSFPSNRPRFNTGTAEQPPHNRVPKRTFDAVSKITEEGPQVCDYTSKKRAMRGLRVRCRSLEKKVRELEAAKLVLESKAGDALRDVKALQTRLEYVIYRSNEVDTTTMCGHAFCEDCIETWYLVKSEDPPRCPICNFQGLDGRGVSFHSLYI